MNLNNILPISSIYIHVCTNWRGVFMHFCMKSHFFFLPFVSIIIPKKLETNSAYPGHIVNTKMIVLQLI